MYLYKVYIMRKTRKKNNKPEKKKNKIVKSLRKHFKKNNKYKLTIGGGLKI